jgi:hypothetical protein
MNPLGEKISTTNLRGKSTPISTSELAVGMYIYQIKYGRGQVKTGRLVISR